MENADTILDAIEKFENGDHSGTTVSVLDGFLKKVAKTGDPLLPWNKISSFLRHKLSAVMTEFYDFYGGDDEEMDATNLPSFAYIPTKNRILNHFDTYVGAPFTMQRLCEILVDPMKHYKRTDKFMRALEKNILVVSHIEPGCKRKLESPHHPFLVVNGMQQDTENSDLGLTQPPTSKGLLPSSITSDENGSIETSIESTDVESTEDTLFVPRATKRCRTDTELTDPAAEDSPESKCPKLLKQCPVDEGQEEGEKDIAERLEPTFESESRGETERSRGNSMSRVCCEYVKVAEAESVGQDFSASSSPNIKDITLEEKSEEKIWPDPGEPDCALLQSKVLDVNNMEEITGSKSNVDQDEEITSVQTGYANDHADKMEEVVSAEESLEEIDLGSCAREVSNLQETDTSSTTETTSVTSIQDRSALSMESELECSKNSQIGLEMSPSELPEHSSGMGVEQMSLCSDADTSVEFEVDVENKQEVKEQIITEDTATTEVQPEGSSECLLSSVSIATSTSTQDSAPQQTQDCPNNILPEEDRTECVSTQSEGDSDEVCMPTAEDAMASSEGISTSEQVPYVEETCEASETEAISSEDISSAPSDSSVECSDSPSPAIVASSEDENAACPTNSDYSKTTDQHTNESTCTDTKL